MLSLNPTIILAQLALVIAVALGGFFEGIHYKTLEDVSATATAEQAVIAQTQTADRITATASAGAALDQLKIADFTQTRIIEVPVHVTKKSDARCVVPRGFVGLHDTAASGVPAVPLATGQSDDDPSGIALSALAGTVAGNYGTCRQTRQQLIDLQAWVRAQAASLATFRRAGP
jgi:hypothetical protein